VSQQRALQLSRELRTANTPGLRRRRTIVGLSLIASGSMAPIAAYQTGLIRHLPELPRFDADKVDASAILGLGSYAATMGLAAMGGSDRAREKPLIPLALAVKVAFDVANAAKLSVDQWRRHRAFCFWCLLAGAASMKKARGAMPRALHCCVRTAISTGGPRCASLRRLRWASTGR
jgi:hypothetical protein